MRIVTLTKAGKELIAPIFRKHTAEIARLFGDATPRELQVLESVLKKAGKRALAVEKNFQKPRGWTGAELKEARPGYSLFATSMIVNTVPAELRIRYLTDLHGQAVAQSDVGMKSVLASNGSLARWGPDF